MAIYAKCVVVVVLVVSVAVAIAAVATAVVICSHVVSCRPRLGAERQSSPPGLVEKTYRRFHHHCPAVAEEVAEDPHEKQVVITLS